MLVSGTDSEVAIRPELLSFSSLARGLELVFGLQLTTTGRAVVATVNLRERSEINHADF
jgi:hypothetical protein